MKKYIVEVYEDRTEWKNEDKQLHRTDGPAVEWLDGSKEWWVDDKRHREDGPAIEWNDGHKEWWVDGKFHREDGPAVEYANGTKQWWVEGKLHRLDGPAIERRNGSKSWYIEGKKLTESEFNKRTKQPTCEDKVIEICGVKYKLTKV